MSSLICYANLIEDATVTVTSEATGFAKENAYDWRGSDWWQAGAAGTVYLTADFGSAQTFDYWAVGLHDLNDNAGTIKPQYSTDNFAADTNDFDTAQTPSNSNFIVQQVTSRNVRYGRFEIASTGSASNIGHLAFGQALTLPSPIETGFRPALLGRDHKILNNITEAGNYTGSSIQRKGYTVEIIQTLVTPAWVDANWEALMDHIQIKPFLFVWDLENRPTEAAYCRAIDIDPPKYAMPNFMSFSIKCKAWL